MSRISRVALKGIAKGIPVGRLLLAGDVALLTGRHIARLSAHERRRLLTLVGLAATRRGALGRGERDELQALVAKLEPRLLLGTAVRRVSPVPIPRRLLYGRRGSAARAAAKRRS